MFKCLYLILVALLKIMEICPKFSRTDLANMDTNTLNYRLSNFVQEVANSEGKVYPARTLYGIICGIRRHLEETRGGKRSIKFFGLMLLIKGKKGYRIYVQCKIYPFHRRLLLEYRSSFKLSIFYCRFAIFRRCLNAEMKDSTREGVSLQKKKEEKEAVTDEHEEKFWSAGLFGSGTAKQLLDIITHPLIFARSHWLLYITCWTVITQ